MKTSLNNTIIAEIGSVHDGSFGNAGKLVELAAELGADIVKFQTHIAEFETLKSAPSPKHFDSEPRYEYFERTSFSKDQWINLKKIAETNSLEFMSSPFSIQAVNLLEDIGVRMFKVASGEVTNLPLIERIAETGKPVFLSSGMSNWEELDAAVEILKDSPLVVMQCSSMYPCEPKNVGLNVMQEMKTRYGIKSDIGFSDHSSNVAAGVAAATLGAKAIEKHLTFSKKMYGSDARFALEPKEFRFYVQTIREAWEIMENPVDKSDIKPFLETRRVFQKSIVFAQDLEAGHKITFDDLAFMKPGGGISPPEYKKLLGRTLRSRKAKGEVLAYEDLA
jgi:N,N'-diacetyllegionaminate synthase